MELAISRFLNVEIGRDDSERLAQVFSTSIRVQLILGLAIVLVGLAIGPWLLSHVLVIQPDRLAAANFVYRCSILLIPLTLFMCPFNAAITAHEDMHVYAYMSIYTASVKLAVALYLIICPFDKLETYAFLLTLSGLVMPTVLIFYCRRHYPECRSLFHYKKKILKEMMGFAGWNLMSSSAFILRTQGLNVLLNIFARSTIVNAAAQIATTVVDLLYMFVGNFIMAINPTVYKTYAANDIDRFTSVVNRGTKFSTYLLLFLTLPFFVRTEYILYLWLGEVPEYSVVFMRLIILYTLNDTVSRIMMTGQMATGCIRGYTLKTSSIVLLTLPLAALFLWLGAPPAAVYIAQLITSVIALIARSVLFKSAVKGWSTIGFLTKVYLPIILTSAVAGLPTWFVSITLPQNFWGTAVVVVFSFVATILSAYTLGLNSSERSYIKSKIPTILAKLHLSNKPL